jgi:hypothetical protein
MINGFLPYTAICDCSKKGITAKRLMQRSLRVFRGTQRLLTNFFPTLQYAIAAKKGNNRKKADAEVVARVPGGLRGF